MFIMQDNSCKKSQIKQNILQFIEYKGITRYKFYQITGITRGVLDQNNGMNEDNIARFLDSFPDINANWLITGRGSMLKSNVSIENGDGSTQVIDDGNNINTPSTLDKALDALAKSQEQIDRLIVVIEKLTDK